MNRFKGKTILVTGAGSGIGAACVQRLHDQGASIAAADMDRAAIDTVQSGLHDTDAMLGVQVDVSDRSQVERFVAQARERFGKLHGLIHCAGITSVGGVLDCAEDAWRRVLGVNLDGTFFMCQAFARAVKDDPWPRAIVTVSSSAGILGVPNRLAYVASKFGVSGMTRTMGAELAPFGIRVNAVAPGTTDTPLTAYLLNDPEKARRQRAAHPIGRVAQPQEIAAVATFLLSDDASFMTGAVVSVDGGHTACLPNPG